MRLYYIEYFVLQYVFQKSPQRGWGLLGKAPSNASPFFHIAAGRFRSPSHVLNARNGGRPFPLACLKRPQRRASVPPHHLWRGGDRQAGGEVMGTIALPQRRGLKIPQSKMRRRDFLTAFGVCVKPHAAARVLRRMA